MKNIACLLISLLPLPLQMAMAVTTPMAHPVELTTAASVVKTSADFDQLARQCAPSVHPATLAALVHVESSYNPYAIGVVGGHLSRQPVSLDEALATVAQLEADGRNFSMGLGQVNRYNLQRHHVDIQSIFEPCRNLAVGAAILAECFTRAKTRFPNDQTALRAAFSCYYSGNFTTGYQHGYVQKVVAQAGKPPKDIPIVPALIRTNVDANPVKSALRPITTPARRSLPPSSAIKIASQKTAAADNDIYVYVAPGAQPAAAATEAMHE